MSTDETPTPEQDKPVETLSHTPPHPTPQPEPAARHRARRLLPAAIAAAVLVVGGGTAYLAVANSGNPDNAAAGSSGDRSADPDPDPAPRLVLRADPQGLADPQASRGLIAESIDYRLRTALPHGPDSAELLNLKRSGDSRATAVRLAGVFEVPGNPQRDGAGWRVGGKDGGPLLYVPDDAARNWTYARAATGARPYSVRPPVGDSPPQTTLLKDRPQTGDRPQTDPVEPALNAEEAQAKARPVLKKLGLADADLDTDSFPGPTRRVLAAPKVQNAPTHGLETVLQVSADGISTASGPVTATASGTDHKYPVGPAEQALQKLNSESVAARPGCTGRPLPSGKPGAPAKPDASPGTDDRGGLNPCAGSRRVLEVRGAEFGRVLRLTGEGKPVLVPAWLFTVGAPDSKDTSVRAALAVKDSAVTEEAPPNEQPGPGTSKPDGPLRTRTVDLTEYRMEGKTLVVRLTGGVCEKYSAKATSTAGKVTVTATETAPRNQVCVKMAKQHTLRVPLDKPLGNRPVIDSYDGDRLAAPR